MMATPWSMRLDTSLGLHRGGEVPDVAGDVLDRRGVRHVDLRVLVDLADQLLQVRPERPALRA